MSDFASYAIIIDARSPHEYADDHVPGAQNLPVVDDAEFAEVGIKHKHDPHAAYLIGVEYSLHNIANYIKPLIAEYSAGDRMLVYCFRGGKRSKLWADNLRTIGFEVDVLRGGWKAYRRWVRQALEELPAKLELRVLSGATGCGKTRLLHALRDAGEQILDLEGLARHRGSLIGAVPGVGQPTQKYFDSLVLQELRKLDPAKAVWLEAESKKIGNLQLPESLHSAMHKTIPIHITAPMAERVRLWREDYGHLAADPKEMVERLSPLKPLIGGEELQRWHELAAQARVDELFERVMSQHYDPCYSRSTNRAYGGLERAMRIDLSSLGPASLRVAAEELVARFSGQKA